MFEDLKKEFIKYTDNYKGIDGVDLKVRHTFRVMNLCTELAKSLNFSDEDVALATVCGLLHDIGRFEQLKKYHTFVDSKSVDHGDLGVDILKENNFLRKFNKKDEDDSLILKTVKYHNKYELPDDLNEREEIFCKIVRDADKIDILYLYLTDEINIDTNDEDFSIDVFESLLNRKTILRSIKKNKADNLAVSLGFVFDIYLKHSYEILKREDYLNKEIDKYKEKTNNENFKEQLEEVRMVINRYIEEMI